MVTTLSSGVVKKASKRHHCDSWERYLEEHKEHLDGYKCAGIDIGESYEYQNNVDMGELWSFKSCLKCQKVAKEHDIQLYDEY